MVVLYKSFRLQRANHVENANVFTTECFQRIHVVAAHSAYGMFSWYKYLIVNLVFSYLGFWSGNLFYDCAFS